MKFVIATHNRGKIVEFKRMLEPMGIEVVTAELSEPEETGTTFEENAFIKAEAACRETGLPAVADDSGLCVDHLGGEPGIYSARFSGEGDAANRRLLLKRLEGIVGRKAYFESAVCLCMPDGKTYFGEGRTHGRILQEEIGENGFGYDCLFYSDDLKKSFGLASAEEKNSVSHRYRALCDLRKKF